VNANFAALTARAAKRRGPPRGHLLPFFQAEITLEKRKKEGTKCKKDNTRLGENCCGRRSKSRGECSKLTPPFTITASGTPCLRWNSASAATCNPDHSTPIRDGSNGNGKSARGRNHDTYFVVAHFHYIMVGGAIMGYLRGLHFWWPKITGRMYPEFLARAAAIIVFLGFNLTFFPQFILGYLGMPRRYHSYPPEFQTLNVISTAGASILGIGYLLPLIYFAWSMRYGKAAGPNPWPSTGLEWQTASPPPSENFHVTPEVTWEPYDFVNRPDLGLETAGAPLLAPAHGDD
jgi:hypothetical protein